jgi:hypothetical protein
MAPGFGRGSVASIGIQILTFITDGPAPCLPTWEQRPKGLPTEAVPRLAPQRIGHVCSVRIILGYP